LSAPRKLAFACLAVILGFVLLEVAGRVVELFREPLPVDYRMGFDADSRVYVPDRRAPAWRVTAPEKRRSFLRQRFRAEKPSGVIRIAAVGGSSVRYAEEELEALRRSVEASALEAGATAGGFTRVELINAGGLGYGSHRLVPIVAELVGYELDLLLVYSGHNEFEEVEQLALAGAPGIAFQETLGRASAFFRLLREGVTALQVDLLERAHNEKLLSEKPAQARAWNHPFKRRDVDVRMAAYERNRRTIVRLAKLSGVPVILGTVPSNHYRPILPPGVRADFLPIFALYRQGDWRAGHLRAEAFLAGVLGRHQSSAVENEILRRVAAGTGTPLADVEARVTAAEPHGVPGETLFRDHCHLNARGNRLLRLTYEPLALDVLGLAHTIVGGDAGTIRATARPGGAVR
jgi:hypothetical protein